VFFLRSSSFPFGGVSAAILVLAIAGLFGGCASVTPRSATTQPTQPAQPTQSILALSATSFNFNTVVVGQSATQTLQITNTGTSAVTINSLSLPSQQFSITGPAVPRTILAAQSVAYTISFVPTTSGNLSASLQIATSVSSTAFSVSLAGIAEQAFAALQVSPSSINFGNLNIKTTGTQTVTLQNTGDISMTISGVTVSGAGFAYANLLPGVSLSPNQTVTFQISFTPQVAGAASGTVSIISSNLSSPASIPLSGDGLSASTPPSTPSVQHSVALSWDASTSSSITGYRVYRSTVSGTGYSPLTSAISALTYTDDTVADSTTYYYVVTAVDSAGVESPYSNQVTAVIPSS